MRASSAKCGGKPEHPLLLALASHCPQDEDDAEQRGHLGRGFKTHDQA